MKKVLEYLTKNQTYQGRSITIIDLAYFTQPLGVKCVIYHSYHDDMFVLSVC